MKFQMEELLFVRKCPFDPLVLGVHKLRVVGQALVVTDVSVERISVVSCVERRAETPVISEKQTSEKLLTVTGINPSEMQSNLQHNVAICCTKTACGKFLNVTCLLLAVFTKQSMKKCFQWTRMSLALFKCMYVMFSDVKSIKAF